MARTLDSGATLHYQPTAGAWAADAPITGVERGGGEVCDGPEHKGKDFRPNSLYIVQRSYVRGGPRYMLFGPNLRQDGSEGKYRLFREITREYAGRGVPAGAGRFGCGAAGAGPAGYGGRAGGGGGDRGGGGRIAPPVATVVYTEGVRGGGQMAGRLEQCQFYGQRNVPFMGRVTKQLVRCQERGTGFWHDGLGDAYCPRHERLIKRRGEPR